MIRALWQYVAEEAWPRKWSIFLGIEFILAVILGVFFAFKGKSIFHADLTYGDFIGAFLAYASIGLGFSLAGFTLAITLPDQNFVKMLVQNKIEPNTNSYSNLLFIFSWTAMIHWMAIVLTCIAFFKLGLKERIFIDTPSPLRSAYTSALLVTCVYCFAHFLITIITLSQVGNLYVKKLDCPPEQTAVAKNHPLEGPSPINAEVVDDDDPEADILKSDHLLAVDPTPKRTKKKKPTT